MLIDEELLMAEPEEADRIYQELKQRTFRRRNLEETENRLSESFKKEVEDEEVPEDEGEIEDITRRSSVSRDSQSSQSFEKIKSFL